MSDLNEKIVDAAEKLILRMYEVYDDPQYRAAFSLLADFQGKYSGKTWTKEQDELYRLLQEYRRK